VTGDLGTVTSPESSDARLWAAASRLPMAASTVELWSGVANDRRYRPFPRGLAAYQLFRRHVRIPVPVGELGSLLAPAGWLHHSAVERVDRLGGEVPVVVPPDGAAFVIRLPVSEDGTVPVLGLYLAVDRVIGAARLRDALSTAATEPATDRATVLDISLFPVD
jgi:hypothetical protein